MRMQGRQKHTLLLQNTHHQNVRQDTTDGYRCRETTRKLKGNSSMIVLLLLNGTNMVLSCRYHQPKSNILPIKGLKDTRPVHGSMAMPNGRPLPDDCCNFTCRQPKRSQTNWPQVFWKNPLCQTFVPGAWPQGRRGTACVGGMPSVKWCCRSTGSGTTRSWCSQEIESFGCNCACEISTWAARNTHHRVSLIQCPHL